MNNFKKNIILGLLKPEETSELIDTIIDRMFAFMTKEERMEYIEEMVPKYVDMAFVNLKPEDKKEESEKIQKKFCSRIDDINRIAVKWLDIPEDQRAEINCC